MGKTFYITGVLEDQSGANIDNKNISFMIDGKYLGQTSTKSDGTFLLKITEDLTATVHRITGSFKGAHLLYPTTTDIYVHIRPATVTVQTVPAVAGVTFLMDGIQFVSDQNGVASLNLYRVGKYELDVLIDKYYSDTQRIEFGRWPDESHAPSVVLDVPRNDVIQVGLNIYHQVSQSFVDLDGFPVDPQRITSITIKSAQGDIFTFKNDYQSHWIPASRIARFAAGLQETKLLYSIISVTIDGSNVVNQAQQRFFADPNDNWPISLMLYSLHIDAKDGLFGSPVGKAVDVQFPDGHTVIYPLDQAGTVNIHSLARGLYHIELTGVDGLSTKMPVALSRIQVVHINVVTRMDIIAVALMGLALALGLLLYGRPWILRRFISKTQAIFPEKVTVPINEN
jgi:hypothetical protein